MKVIVKLGIAFMLSLMASAVGLAQVSVTATAGTTGPTAYTTLKGAFDAVNAGAHQGAITISLSGNTTETATAALNASSAPASYTSVSVTATTAVTISGNIVGAIIRLNGADNVTIDGRIGGAGRNITVQNTSNNAATAAVWLSSNGAGAGATGNTIRNLELRCGVTQNTATSATFGIIMSGTTIAVASNGDDNDNNSFIANRIIRARYGILTRGVTTNNNQNVTVTDNIIGPTAFGGDQIGKVGIFMQADAASTVSRNTVQFVGGDFDNTSATADRVGIAIGVESWSSTPGTITSSGYTVTKNVIHDVAEERTSSSVGLLLGTTNGGSPTNNTVANNMIYNVKSNGGTADQTVGIGISGGNGDRVVYNSVRNAGDLDPNALASGANHTPVALRIANAPANLTVRNNSLYWDVFSSTTTTLKGAVIQVPSSTFAFGTGLLNNNNYYFPTPSTVMNTGVLGTTVSAATFSTDLATWKTALSPAQDANSVAGDPQYFSATDLHIASGSPNVDAAVAVSGITDDFDGDTRPNGANPEIGADEILSSGPGELNFSLAAYAANEGATAMITVTRTNGLTGTVTVNVTQTAGTATGGAACGSGADFVNIVSPQTLTFNNLVSSQTVTVPLCSDLVTDPDETVGFTLSGVTGGATIGATNATTLTITDLAPPAAQFSASEFNGPEAAPSTVVFTVDRVNDPSPAVTVNYTLTNGNAVGGATCAAGVDYINTGGTLNFGAGVISQTITVPICDDSVGDVGETFTATLSGVSANATLGSPAAATGTIDDDDPPPGDTCINAPALTLGVPTIGTLANAANDFTLSAPGASTCFLGFNQVATTAGGRDRVYSFTAPTNGNYSIRAKFAGTGGDLAVYLTTSCPLAATTFNCANSGGIAPVATNAANRNSNVAAAQEDLGCVGMIGGVTYYVVVDETAAGATGLGSYQLEVTNCPSQETEINGDPMFASVAVGGNMLGVIDGAGSDIDFYSFGAPAAGSRLYVMTDTQGSGTTAKDTQLRVTTATDTLEFDDDDGDAPWGGSSSLIAGVPLPGGNVYARVNDLSGANNIDPYNLIYSVRPPNSQSAEVEPNNTIAQANTSSTVGYYGGAISGAADNDYFRVSVNPGDLLFVAVDANPTRDNTCFTPTITLFNEAGKAIITANGSGTATGGGAAVSGTLIGTTTTSCGAALAYRIPNATSLDSPLAQSYYVRVRGSAAGDYLMAAGPVGAPTAPTASGVTIAGRVLNANGQPIRFARLTLDNLLSGERQETQTDERGNFIFDEDVLPGATYSLTVTARGYNFAEATQVLNVNGNLDGVTFRARKRIPR